MPRYDYECPQCGQFEFFQTMEEANLIECPQCHQKGIKKLIQKASGLVFKGSGFYINDSKGPQNSTPSGSDS